MDNFPKCPTVNNTTLTPLTFLKRATACYANHTSVIYGQTRFTWRQTYDRCGRLASSLHALNIAKNDVVSVLAPNTPAMYEMHFGVPMVGGVLNAITLAWTPKTSPPFSPTPKPNKFGMGRGKGREQRRREAEGEGGRRRGRGMGQWAGQGQTGERAGDEGPQFFLFSF